MQWRWQVGTGEFLGKVCWLLEVEALEILLIETGHIFTIPFYLGLGVCRYEQRLKLGQDCLQECNAHIGDVIYLINPAMKEVYIEK